MENVEKIVDFHKYCLTCKYKDEDDVKDPCNDCLNTPVNINSRKPINYKEKEN